jgi:hypothetical protein
MERKEEPKQKEKDAPEAEAEGFDKRSYQLH